MTDLENIAYTSNTITTTVNTLVTDLISDDTKVDLNPNYQREIVWTENQQTEYVFSVLINRIANCITFNNDVDNRFFDVNLIILFDFIGFKTLDFVVFVFLLLNLNE